MSIKHFTIGEANSTAKEWAVGVMIPFFPTDSTAPRFNTSMALRSPLILTEDPDEAERSILLQFIHLLCVQRSRHRRITVKLTAVTLTGTTGEAEFFRFPQAFREMKGFRDIRFELDSYLEEEDRKELLERAYAMRDSLLAGSKRKFEQLD